MKMKIYDVILLSPWTRGLLSDKSKYFSKYTISGTGKNQNFTDILLYFYTSAKWKKATAKWCI